MDEEREPQTNAILNHHFQQTINDRLAKYEKEIDDLFDGLLSRLKPTDHVRLSNGDGDHQLDEFSQARRKEFVKKVNDIREIIRSEFRNDIAKMINTKYSNNIDTLDKEFNSKSFDEMVELFKQLQLADSSVIDRETYSDMIDLFENMNLSEKESNADIIDLLENLTLFSTKSEELDSNDSGDVGNDVSEEDVIEIVPKVDTIDIISSSDDDLVNETEITEKINVMLEDLSALESESDSESISDESFSLDEVEVDELEGETPKTFIEKFNLSTQFSPATLADHRESMRENNHEVEVIEINGETPKTFIEKFSLSTQFSHNTFTDHHKNVATAFTNFMVERRLITIESRLSEEKLRDMYDLYETEFNPEVSIGDQVLPVLESNDIVKKVITISDQNNNEVEFNEMVFLNRNQARLSESAPFRAEIIRTLNPGYFTRFVPFRCPVCKDCFPTKDRLDDHNISEIHILKTIYLKNRSWFVKNVDYLQITGIPDEKLNLAETGTYEISFLNVSPVADKIRIWKIFELVHSGDQMRIEYGSNYCLEKGDLFEIKMRARFTSILTSETLYPIVLKVSQNDDEYEFILIEPHFKVVRTERKKNIAMENRNNYRPPLKPQNNNKRCIIDESSEPDQPLIPDAFKAFHSKRKNAAMERWRVQKEIPKYNPPKFYEALLENNDVEEEILPAPRISRAINIPKLRLPDNHIPPVLRALLKYKFKTGTFRWSPVERELLKRIKKLICEENTLKVVHNKDVITEFNYIERLRYEMWIEEHHALEEMHSFAQEDVDLLTSRLNENLIGISLPGLSEGRPSLLKGDLIIVKSKSANFPQGVKKFEGYVRIIEETAAYVKLNKTFYTEKYWQYKADVDFRFNRNPLKMSHTVLETLRKFKWQESLFPRSFDKNPRDVQLKPFFNESVATNELQVQAVTNIVQNKAFPAPYILFGPPGTGKTATLVEAITQIWATMETSKICVCASSNTAADVIAKRLLQYIPLSDIIRIYGLSRNDAEITSELQGCCNYDAKAKEVFFPCFTELKRKRIVVMTPVTAGRFILNGINFDYIFMDEAGHALEVDVLIPLSGFLGSTWCSMVLAGDPKQLGPVVRSPYANALGYGMSLLERLMTQCDIYKKDPTTGQYNPKVITKLVNNYRSHDVILRIPNQQFYESELRVAASETLISSLSLWNKLPSKGFPMIFHSVKGLEQREDNSPSYFNSKEVDVVQDYVSKLFRSRDLQLDQSEVGIISPYRKQVHKIRQRLLQSWPKISVASVEEFQGQERKVIIISTVRSRRELLATDYKFGLGFLKNEKRFNVAITRAIALLIVIGNPDILQCDPHWREFLKYCSDNSAFIGEPANGILPEDFDPNVNQDLYLKEFQI